MSFIQASGNHHEPPFFHCTAPLLDHGYVAPGMVPASLLTGHGMMTITALCVLAGDCVGEGLEAVCARTYLSAMKVA
jgi:hypothetical protein